MIDWLVADSDVGKIIREFDWSSTSLGPLRSWPQSLRTAVNFMLAARQPVYIAWGRELWSMYNDCYVSIVGEKHPAAMGQTFQQLWSEIWDEYRPYVEAVMGGEAHFWVDQPFMLTSRPNRPIGWFTVSWTPLRDETGAVAGFMSVGSESTERVLAERQLVEVMDEGFCVIEIIYDEESRPVDFRYIRTNPAFEEQTGLQNAKGKLITELVPGIERDWIETNSNVALTGQARRFVNESSSMGKWFDSYTFPIAGTTNRVGSLFRDITKQKQLELELQKNGRRQKFSLEFEDALRDLHSPDEIIETACRLLGLMLQASRVVYCEIDESQKFFFLRRDWTAPGVLSLAGTTKVLNDFGPKVIADLLAGRYVVNTDWTLDHRTAPHADAYRQVGIRVELLVPLIKSSKLHLVLAFHISKPHQWGSEEIEFGKDMAQRTWSAIEAAVAQAQLRTERDRSQAVFDTMTEGFVLIDRHWTVLYMNDEGLRLSGRSGSETIGHHHWEVWSELVGSDPERLYRQVMMTRQPETMEFQFTYPDGNTAWLELRAYPVMDTGMAVLIRDVTDRREAEEKLHDADQRKDEFLAMLAHELRNPLAPIGAAAELLQLVKLDEGRVKQTSKVIARQVSHMTGLIDDLLDVSRVTRGLIELEKVALDMQQVVHEAVEQVSPLIRARSHELTIRQSPHSAIVCADKKRLVQVVSNILNNAAKYTPEGGHLTLCTEAQDSQVLIQVIDDGIGMTPETAKHAFDLFAQAERTSDRSSGGLGLGLALVKSMVELHGGTVTCKSKGLGQGSTFSVWLPLLLEKIHQSSGLLTETDSQPAHATSLRILVVDDNVDAAEMLKLFLEAMGHEVLVEHGPYKALERATLDRPQVCLLDIGLPEIDGNELARRLRAQPGNHSVTLVAISGYGQESDRLNALSAGFDYHLVKPVDTKKLVDILAEVHVP
jgi:PAS domain S-box-containing protein